MADQTRNSKNEQRTVAKRRIQTGALAGGMILEGFLAMRKCGRRSR